MGQIDARGETTDRINLSGTLTLNRAGNFRLRIAVTDKLTKKKVFFEAPLGVSPL